MKKLHLWRNSPCYAKRKTLSHTSLDGGTSYSGDNLVITLRAKVQLFLQQYSSTENVNRVLNLGFYSFIKISLWHFTFNDWRYCLLWTCKRSLVLALLGWIMVLSSTSPSFFKFCKMNPQIYRQHFQFMFPVQTFLGTRKYDLKNMTPFLWIKRMHFFYS